MTASWHIINKVMAKQFYLHNAGFFLFAFMFFFGIVDAGHLVSYHKSLMLSMISLPLFLFFVMIAWMLYNIKCISFCLNAIQSNNGNFLYQLRAFPSSTQYVLYIFVSIILYMPVLIYSIVLAVFAYKLKAAVSWQIIAWQLLMIMMSTTSIFNAINKTNESFITKLAATVRQTVTFKIGYTAFLLAYIFNQRKIAFAIVKVFLLLMLGMLLVRNGDSFDADLFAICFPLALTAHASLVMYGVDFNETFLHSNRNLPLHWLQVAIMYLSTWLVILLPEMAFMFINNHGNLPMLQIIMEAVTAIVALFLYTGMALGCGLNKERYLLFVFMSYTVVLILQKALGHAGAAVALAVLSLMVFKAHYYSFEREHTK